MEDLIQLNDILEASKKRCDDDNASLNEALSVCKQNQTENEGIIASLTTRIVMCNAHATILGENNIKLREVIEAQKNNVQNLIEEPKDQEESDESLDEELEEQEPEDQPESHAQLDGKLATQPKHMQLSSTPHSLTADGHPETTTDAHHAMRTHAQAQHADIMAYITAQREKHAKLEADITTHEKKIEKHAEEVRSLEDKLTKLNEQINSLKSQNSNLEADKNQLEEEKNDLAEQYRKLAEKHKELDREHKKLEVDKNKLEEEHRELQQEKIQFQEEKGQLEQEKSQLEQQIAFANATITSFSNRISTLSSRTGGAKNNGTTSASNVEAYIKLSRERRVAEQQQADRRVRLCSTQAEIDKLQDQLKRKNKKLNKSRFNRKNIKNKLNRTRETLQGTMVELQKTKQTLEKYKLLLGDIHSQINTTDSPTNSRHSRRSVEHKSSSHRNKGADAKGQNDTDPYKETREKFESDADVIEKYISNETWNHSNNEAKLVAIVLDDIKKYNRSLGIISDANSIHPIANGSDQVLTGDMKPLFALCSLIYSGNIGMANTMQDPITDNSTQSNNSAGGTFWPYVIGSAAVGLASGAGIVFAYFRHKFQKNDANAIKPDALPLLSITPSNIDQDAEGPSAHDRTHQLVQDVNSFGTTDHHLSQSSVTSPLTTVQTVLCALGCS